MENSFAPINETFTVEELINILTKLPNQKAKLKIYLNEGKGVFDKTGRYDIVLVDNIDLFDGTVVDLAINPTHYLNNY